MMKDNAEERNRRDLRRQLNRCKVEWRALVDCCMSA